MLRRSGAFFAFFEPEKNNFLSVSLAFRPQSEKEAIMRKMIMINQKGGCGKTTTAISLASCLAAEKRRVLLIDMDPQGHAGLGLGLEAGPEDAGIYEVLSGRIGITQAIRSVRPNLDAVLSSLLLSTLEQELAGISGREFRLRQCLAEVEDSYDYLIVDSPPNLGLLTINGLMAATEAIIPVDPSPFSINGLGQLLETIRLLEKHTGHAPDCKIVAVNVDRRTRFGNILVETLQSRYPLNSAATVIHTSTRLREAAARGKSIFEFDRNALAGRNYLELAREILKAEKRVARQRQKVREVSFALDAPADAMVQIAGDFTDWQPVPLALRSNGNGARWQKTVRLKPGAYQYKYLVNGKWLPDPGNRNLIDNGLGTRNSCITV
jgi:chromosome partitioning protein